MPVFRKQKHLLPSVSSEWPEAAVAQQGYLPRKKSLQHQNNRGEASLPLCVVNKEIISRQQPSVTAKLISIFCEIRTGSKRWLQNKTVHYEHYQPQHHDYMFLNTRLSHSVFHLPRPQCFLFQGSPKDWKYLDTLRPEKIPSSFSSSVTTASLNHWSAYSNLTI